jgi:hypothetical protein
MRMVHLHEIEDQNNFARRAASHFRENENHWSYTDGDIKEGALFALRFGMARDCVLIFEIGSEPINYQNIIGD